MDERIAAISDGQLAAPRPAELRGAGRAPAAAHTGRHRARRLRRDRARQCRRLPIPGHARAGHPCPGTPRLRRSQPSVLCPPARGRRGLAARRRVRARAGAAAGHRAGRALALQRALLRGAHAPRACARRRHGGRAGSRRLRVADGREVAWARSRDGRPPGVADRGLRGRVHHRALLGVHGPARRRVQRIPGQASALACVGRGPERARLRCPCGVRSRLLGVPHRSGAVGVSGRRLGRGGLPGPTPVSRETSCARRANGGKDSHLPSGATDEHTSERVHDVATGMDFRKTTTRLHQCLYAPDVDGK